MLKTMILLLVTGVAIAAGAAETDAAAAARYRGTFLKRFSAGAKTKELPISVHAARFTDLLLDYHRNRAAGQDPDSPAHHRGVAHLERTRTAGTLTLTVAYVMLNLDSATLPIGDAPGLLAVVLRPEFAAKAKLATENDQSFERMRLLLVAELVNFAPPAPPHSKVAATALLKALDATAPEDSIIADALSIVIDDAATAPLIEQAKAVADPARRANLLKVIASARNKTAAQFVQQALASGSDIDRSTILSCVPADCSETVFAQIAALVADTHPTAVAVAALSALERHKTARARTQLETRFAAMADNQLKYNAACALTRMGSQNAVGFLQGKLAEWQNDPKSTGRVDFVRRLLDGAK